MERCIKTRRVKTMLILIFTVLHFMLMRTSYAIEEGIVLYFPDKGAKDAFRRLLKRLNGNFIELRKCKKPPLKNDSIVVANYQSFITEDLLYSYMECKKHLPLLMVSGVIPDRVKKYSNVISCEGMELDLEDTEWCINEYKKFTSFLENHVEEVNICVKEVGTIYDDLWKYNSSFYATLLAVGWVYRRYLLHQECACFDAKQLREVVEEMYIDDLDDDVDLLSVVRKSLYAGIEKNTDVVVDALDRVDDTLLMDIEARRAILYDEDKYYVPEELLRAFTEELHDVMSFRAIKGALYNRGALVCNNAENNFTIKKVIISDSYKSIRARFLTLLRSKLDTTDEFTLAERGRSYE